MGGVNRTLPRLRKNPRDHCDFRYHSRMRKKANLLANILLVGLIIFAVLLGAPVIGVLVGQKISATYGCTLEAWGGPCLATGFWPSRLKYYGLPIANFIGTPLFFLMAFWDIVLGWLAAIGVLKTIAKLEMRWF